MPTATGFLTRAALVREPLAYARTWPGTAAEARRLLPLLSEDLEESYEQPPRHAVPSAYARPGTRRQARVGGPLRVQATYDGIEHVWALALGAMAYRVEGVALPEELTPGAYRHLYECAETLHSTPWPAGCGALAGTDALIAGLQTLRRATVVVDKQVSAWECLSCMVGGLDLDAGPDGVFASLALVAHALERASATNPDLDGAAPAPAHPVAWTDLELRLGPYSTSTPLDAGDAYAVTSVRLRVENALSVRGDVARGLHIAEPKRRGPAQVSGDLTLPRYSADTVLEWAAEHTELMASLVFTGPQIAATGYAYTLRLLLPCVRLAATSAPSTGAEEHAPRVALWAYAPQATPAGFAPTWLAGPLTVELVTDRAAHPLLEVT